MKGISPVIATVLLLLMAVASVGGAWVWYQRQSTMVGGQTEEQINQQVEQQTGVSISLAGLFSEGTSVGILVNNGATSDVNVTGYKISVGGTSYVNTSATATISAKDTSSFLTTVTTTNCSTGSTAEVQLFAAGTSTQIYEEDCP